MAIAVGHAYANPQDGVVSSGSANITSGGSTLNIHQSTDRAVIDWRSFDIGASETTRFYQPSSSSVTLNRVNSTSPSFIDGHLIANGNIFVINQNGVLFGQNSKVDVNGLVASTADMTNANFMAGNFRFDQAGNPNATIENRGQMTAGEAGLIGLVAPNVLNSGIIHAKLGRVHLASGDTTTVDLYGDGLMEVAAGDYSQQRIVENTGKITAEGGTIAMTAAAGAHMVNSLIRVSGELHAPSVGIKNGKIIIAAEGSNAVAGNVKANKGKKSGSSTVIVDGTLDVSAQNPGEKGGSITITADHIAVMASAVLNATGLSGGGTIHIGGEYLGGGVTPAADYTIVQTGAIIDASAIDVGNGGEVIVYSDGNTEFGGTIISDGAGDFGDGGFAETSGRQNLLAMGTVQLRAGRRGKAGTWLLDPADITITASTNTNITGSPNFTANGTASQVSAANIKTLLDAGTNVSIVTSNDAYAGNGDIIVNSAISTTGNGSLTLSAFHNITVNSGITLNGGNLTLCSDNTGIGDGSVTSSAGLSTNGGNITIGGGAGTITAGSGFAVGNSAQPAGALLSAGVNAGGGNIIINGSAYSAAGTNRYGVYTSSNIATTGSGTITINGVGTGVANTGFANIGVWIVNGGNVSTQNGLLSIIGVDQTAGTGSSWGVYISPAGSSTVKTTGSGDVNITGTARTASGGAAIATTVANAIQTTGVGNIVLKSIAGYTGMYATVANAINTASGNITIYSDSYAVNAAGAITSANNLTLVSYTNRGLSLGANVAGTTNIDNTVLGNLSAGSTYIFGSLLSGSGATNTSDITINTTRDFGTKNVTFIAGGNISLAGNLTKVTGSGTATYLLQANGNITNANLSGVSATTGSINLILNSDYDQATSLGGYITLGGGTFNTNGGSFTAGGGITPLAGNAYNASGDGFSASPSTVISTGAGNINIRGENAGATANSGVYITGTLTTTSGAINIYGQSSANNSGARAILINSTATISSTSGNITLTGFNNSGNTGAYGFLLYNSGTTGGTISSTSGNILIDTSRGSNETSFGLSTLNVTNPAISSTNGNITILADKSYTSASGTQISAANGTLTIATKTNATMSIGSAVGTLNFTNAELAMMSAASYVFGSTTSGNLTVNTTQNFGNSNLTFMTGGDLTLAGTLSKTSGASLVNYILRTNGSIVNSGSSVVTASNGMINLTLQSDYDANNDGAISLSGGTFYTNGGDITIGGGSGTITSGSGYAVGNNTYAKGVTVSSALNAVGGNIIINGKGANLAADNNYGVYTTLNITTSGSGSISINGIGGGNTTSNNNYGVRWAGGAISKSGASGSINITGTGGNASGSGNNNIGVYTAISGGLLTTGGAAINITGTGSNSTGGANYGVYFNNGTIAGSGGAVTLIGTGGAGTSSAGGTSNIGIYFLGTSSITNSGNINLTGTSGSGGGAVNSSHGVNISGSLTATGSGAITISGTGATNPSAGGFSNHGVNISAMTISAAGGAITITGQGGGTNSGNEGVRIASASNITNTGSGTITINGAGNLTSGFNSGYGVDISASTVSTVDGNLIINGTGGLGGGVGNYGLILSSAGVISSVNGNISITGTGGGNSSATANHGVYIAGANSTIKTTGSGSLSITGTGGNLSGTGGTNHGVYSAVANGIQTTGSGSITIKGIKGGQTSSYGVLSDIANELVTTGTGNITVFADTLSTTVANAINSIGVLTLAPYTNISMGVGTLSTGTLTVSDTLLGYLNGASYVFGAVTTGSGTTSTSDLTVNTTKDFATKNVTFISGNNINLAGALTKATGTGTTTYLLQANKNIYNSSSAGISATSGVLNLTLQSDYDANSDGAVNLSGGSFITNGGNITIGGGSGTITAGNGYAVGNATYVAGVNIASTLTAGGGNIIINGKGFSTATNSNYGVTATSSMTTTGTGTIILTGIGQGTGTSATDYGVYLTTGAALSTVNGDLSIIGTSNGGSGVDNIGVYALGGSTIQTTGSGNVNITGTSNATGGNSKGIYLANSPIILSGAGSANLTGTGSAISTGSYNIGIQVGGTTVINNTGTGSINITGTGGGISTGQNNYGVMLQGGNLQTVNGAINVTGIGGNLSGTGSGNDGIYTTSSNAAKTTGSGSIIVKGAKGGTSGSGVYASAANALTTTGTGDIIVYADALNLSIANAFNSIGILTLAPYTNIGMSVGTNVVSTFNVDNTTLGYINGASYVFGALITGSGSTSTGDVTVNTTKDFVNKNVTFISGNNINLAGTLTKATGTGTANYLFQSKGSFYNTNTAAIQATTGALNVTLQSDYDGNSDGAVNITGGGIASNGGNIIIGGGSGTITSGSGYAVGNATYTTGVYIGGALAAAGGNIIVNAKGYLSSSNNIYGFQSVSGISTTGSGTISLNGIAQGSGNASNGYGLYIQNAVTSTNGNITFIGTGGGAGSGANNYGTVFSSSGGFARTSGTGNINVTGTGGAGSGGNQIGVLANYATSVQTLGTGTISLTGTGGISSGASNYGISVNGGITGAGGAITLNGTGGNGSGDNSIGVAIGPASVASITNTGFGTIVITGNGAGITNSGTSYGVYIYNGSTISTVSGALNIIGAGGGAGTGAQNYGVNIAGNLSSIKTTGSGAITVIGTGGNGTGSGSNNHGVLVNTNNSIQSQGTGTLSVTGTGSNSSGGTNLGVNILGSISSVGGAMTITGTGGSGSGNSNDGIRVNAGTVSNTSSGTITMNGTGGGTSTSNGNYGIWVVNAGTVSTVNGAISLTGTGGLGSGGGNHGVGITSAGASTVKTTGSGNITISGTRGTTSGSGINLFGITNGIQTTGTGNIILLANTFNLDTANTVNSIGSLTIAPLTNATMGIGSGAGTVSFTDAMKAYTIAASYIYGSTTTGDLTVNTAYDYNDKNVTFISGGNITLAGTLTKATGVGTANYLFQANGNITNSGGAGVTASSGAINLTLTSDYDVSGAGNIALTSAGFLTNNGTITMNSNGQTINMSGTIGGATTMNSSNGGVTIGALDGTTAGTKDLTVNAGTGTFTTTAAIGATNKLRDVTINADDVAIGANMGGTGTLTLQPYSTTRIVRITGTGDFNLSNTELGYFVNGWSTINIGRTNSTVRNYFGATSGISFQDNVVLRQSAGTLYNTITMTDGANFTVTGNMDFYSNVTTNGGTITVGGTAYGGSGATLSTSGGNVTLAQLSTWDSNTGLSVNSGGGNIAITGVVTEGGTPSGVRAFNLNAGTGTLSFGNTVNTGANITANAGAITFSGAWGGTSPLGDVNLTSVNSISLPSATTIAGKSVNATVTGAGSSITTTGAIATGSGGNITLSADDLILGGNLSGTGNLTLQPYSNTRAIKINYGTADGTHLNLNTTELGYLVDGWSGIYVGKSSGSSAYMDIGATAWNDPVYFRGWYNRVRGAITGLGNTSFNFNGTSTEINTTGTVISTQGQSVSFLHGIQMYMGGSSPTISTNGGNITIAENLQVGTSSFGTFSLLSGGGNIIVGDSNNVISPGALTSGAFVFNAGTGDITLNGKVNAAADVTVNGSTLAMSGVWGGTTSLKNVILNSINSITLPTISANSILAQTADIASDIIIGSGKVLTASGSGSAITLVSARNILNNNGSSTPLVLTGAGRFLTYSTNPSADSLGGMTSNFVRYGCTYAGSCPTGVTVPASGNGNIYTYRPTITVSPTAIATIYGDAAPSLNGYTYTASGYLTGAAGNEAGLDGLTGTLVGTTTYLQGADIGTYNINYSSGSITSGLGYLISYTNNTSGINVGKRTLTVGLTGTSDRIYDGTDVASVVASNYNISNFYGGDASTVSLLNTAVTYDDKNVSNNKIVTVSGLSLSGAKSGNYQLAANTISGAIGNITKKALNIIGLSGVDRVYNGTKVAGISGTATLSGNVSGDNVTISVLGTGEFADKNVGTAKSIAVTGYNISGTDAGNYDLIQPATLTADITKATLNIGATVNNMTYNGGVSTTATLNDNRISGDVLTTSYTTANFSDKNADTGKTVIVSGINLSGTDAGNYNFNTNTTTTADIYKKGLTVTADDQTIIYGTSVPSTSLNYNGFIAGEDQTFLNTAPVIISSNSGIINAGHYTSNYTVSGGVDQNYNFTYVAGDLTVTKKTLNVTADGRTVTYGINTPVTSTISYNGFIAGEDATFLTVVPTVASALSGPQNTGTYLNNYTASGGISNNYDFNYFDGNLVVAKRNLAVSADNKSIPYGTAVPTGSITYSGFVLGQDQSVLSILPTVSSSTVGIINAGSYANNYTVSGGVAANYNLIYTTGDLNVTQAGVNVTVNNRNVIYGTAVPTTTLSYSGFLNGDDETVLLTLPTITSAHSGIINAGTYIGNYTASGASAANYVFNYIDGNLTISPKVLNVTAGNRTITYGDTITTPGLTYTGFISGENIAFLSSAPIVTSLQSGIVNSGTYTGNFAVSGGASNNYSFNYVAGDLNVAKKNLIVAANNQTITYGTVVPGTTTLLYTGFVNGENNTILDTQPVVTSSLSGVQNVGTYASNYIVGGANDNNYSFTYVNGALTVNAASSGGPVTTSPSQSTVPTTSDLPNTYVYTFQKPVVNNMSYLPLNLTLVSYQIINEDNASADEPDVINYPPYDLHGNQPDFLIIEIAPELAEKLDIELKDGGI